MSLGSLVGLLLERDTFGRAIVVFTLVAARLAPLALLAPWLGLRAAPAMVRSIVIVGLAFTLTPIADASVHASLPSPGLLPLVLVREGLIGAVFAVISAAPFHALEAAGRLIDLHRGANLAEVLAPPLEERTSPLGDLALLSGLALFASVGGLRLGFEAFAASLVEVPVGSAALGASETFLEAAAVVTGALSFAAMVATPAAIAVVAADVGLGLLARSVPRISIFFLGMPLRATVGLVFAFASLGVAIRVGVERAEDAVALASRLVR